jgi:hypothetical protein
MAFPISSTPTDSGALSGTSQSIPLPTHSTGDRLVVEYAVDSATVGFYDSHTAGWDLRLNQADTQNAIALLIFEKIAASGSESLSVTLTVTKNARAFSRVITGSDTSAPIEVTTANSSGSPSSTPNPPSVTPSWGAADALVIATSASDNSGSASFSAYPASYSLYQANAAVGTSSTPTLATAAREITTTSEDPGAYTIGANDQWVCATIAIKPVGGGDTTAPTLTSPDFTATGATTGTATVSTDEGNGTLFCVITTSATSPSVAQVKAGNDHTGTAAAFAAGSGSGQAVSATGTQTVNVTGLADSTAYYAHFVQTDAAANDSTVSTDATGDTTDTPDTTAPVLSSPVGTTTGATTATVGATTDEANGTLYGVVTTSATAPSAAQIKAGQDHTGAAAVFDDSQAVSSTGAKTFSATGLTASTAYRAHLIHTDAAANDSNIVTSAEFTTDAAVSSDIRLQPGLYLERGGQAASLTADRWWVFTSDLSAVENTGTALSINSSGQPTIDINSSASYVVGDWVPLGLTVYDEGSDPEDRTVRTHFGWTQAIAQS